MWIQSAILIAVCFASGAFGDCDNDIHVAGVSQGGVNGVYKKEPDQCDSRDVFNHTDNDFYLYHIEQGSLTGFWMIRDDYDCNNVNEDVGIVRNNDGEFNPGLVQTGWQEYRGGDWVLDNDIDVDCYASCRYELRGAMNSSLNGYYDLYGSGNEECSFRDVYKHENQELYLYYEWSDNSSPQEYWWQVYHSRCHDAVDNGAYLQVDDYSAAPHYIFNTWQERQNEENSYTFNENIDIDCFGGDPGTDLSPGAIAGIVIGCLAGVAIIGGIIFFCMKRD